MTHRRVTLADVAARSNVSVATASCALSGNWEDRFSPETIKRVIQAADELGYVRNQVASSLKAGRTRTIALFYSAPMDRFIERFQLELSKLLSNQRYTLVAIAVLPDRSTQIDQAMSSGMYDAAILACDPAINLEFVSRHARPPIPVMAISPGEELDHYDTVITNEASAIEIALQYLLDTGAQRIGFASQTETVRDAHASQRWKAYCNFMENRGLTPELVLTSGQGMHQVFDAGIKLFTDARETPAAIYCDADRVAIGLLVAARSCGRKIPEQLQLVGTGASLESAHTQPPLTTIGLSDEAIHTAVTQLMQRLRSPQTPTQVLHLPWEVFLRGTTWDPAPADATKKRRNRGPHRNPLN